MSYELTYEDFAALGNYLHELSQRTYNRFLSMFDKIRQLR